MSSEYIYTMYRVDKFYGPERQVLQNISLSFFPGAKIGVLAVRGEGGDADAGGDDHVLAVDLHGIGRASCRERVCLYV